MNNWEFFYKVFPDTSGIISFSRVGLNSNRDQALVYFVWEGFHLAARGQLILLEKTDGKWIVVGGQGIWMS